MSPSCCDCADDSPGHKVLMRKLLRGFDVELEEAQNGEMAVAYFEKGNTCDLIFMDKDMPIMDGYEVATRLLRSSGVRTPIIALSASNLQSDKDLFFEAGANEYQTKPLSREKLNCILANWIV